MHPKFLRKYLVNHMDFMSILSTIDRKQRYLEATLKTLRRLWIDKHQSLTRSQKHALKAESLAVRQLLDILMEAQRGSAH